MTCSSVHTMNADGQTTKKDCIGISIQKMGETFLDVDLVWKNAKPTLNVSPLSVEMTSRY